MSQWSRTVSYFTERQMMEKLWHKRYSPVKSYIDLASLLQQIWRLLWLLLWALYCFSDESDIFHLFSFGFGMNSTNMMPHNSANYLREIYIVKRKDGGGSVWIQNTQHAFKKSNSAIGLFIGVLYRAILLLLTVSEVPISTDIKEHCCSCCNV